MSNSGSINVPKIMDTLSITSENSIVEVKPDNNAGDGLSKVNVQEPNFENMQLLGTDESTVNQQKNSLSNDIENSAVEVKPDNSCGDGLSKVNVQEPNNSSGDGLSNFGSINPNMIIMTLSNTSKPDNNSGDGLSRANVILDPLSELPSTSKNCPRMTVSVVPLNINANTSNGQKQMTTKEDEQKVTMPSPMVGKSNRPRQFSKRAPSARTVPSDAYVSWRARSQWRPNHGGKNVLSHHALNSICSTNCRDNSERARVVYRNRNFGLRARPPCAVESSCDTCATGQGRTLAYNYDVASQRKRKQRLKVKRAAVDHVRRIAQKKARRTYRVRKFSERYR